MIDVNKAKQKILDLAIRGALTKQLKPDGNAADLLVEIQKEKEKLIKDKKIRNDASVISDDIEEPFEIPENWVWCKIGAIGIYKKGPFGSSLKKSLFVEKSKDTIKVYEQQNAINHNSNLGNYYISKEYFESKMKGFEVLSGDLIVSCAGTIGEIYLMPEKIERGIINQALMKIRLFGGIDKQYFIKYFEYNLKQSASEGNGSAIINIPPFEVLKNYAMPIPPLAEQNRIAEKVNKLFDILDKIDEAQKKYEKDKEILKSKIIEAGIRGKLTKQLKSDGNASDLLDEIRKEKEKLIKEGKIKRDKKETYIYRNKKDKLYYEKFITTETDILNKNVGAKQSEPKEKCIQDELPFEIPDNWVWCRAKEIVEIKMGQSPRGININTQKGMEFHQGKIFFGDKFLKESNIYTKEITKIAEANSILLCVRAPVGELNITKRDVCIGRGLCALKPYYSMSNNYVYYVFSLFKKYFNDNSTGATFNAISNDVILGTLIPLPPIAEQKRIINIVEKLLAYIDD